MKGRANQLASKIGSVCEVGEGFTPGAGVGNDSEEVSENVEVSENSDRTTYNGYRYKDSDGVEKENGYQVEKEFNVADVIKLILISKEDPDNPLLDINGDGMYSMIDAVKLLIMVLNS